MKCKHFYRRLRMISLSCLLLFTAAQFYKCSDNEPSEVPIDVSKPHSVSVLKLDTNMPTGGIITSQYSDSPTGADVSKLIDKKIDTKFTTNHSEFYVIWEGMSAASINSYYIISALDAPQRDPKSWDLSGSNDGKNWTLLDSQTDQSFSSRGQRKEYDLAEEVEFIFFRLDIKENNGAQATQMAEWIIRLATGLEQYEHWVEEANPNLPGEGTLTVEFSDYPAGNDISKALDGNSNTKFVTSRSSFYIQWHGNSPAVVNCYTIGTADQQAADLKEWTLSASADGQNWTMLDSRRDQSCSYRNSSYLYFVDNSDSYPYYRLDVVSNNGGTTTEISEFTLEFEPEGIEDLEQYFSGHTRSDKTPMGPHFDSRANYVTTEENRAWLLDPDNEPPIQAADKNFKDSDFTMTAFPVTLYPFGEPQVVDANQRSIGNCCAIAVYGSLAYTAPEFIKKIITDNKDNTYTVDMYDPQGKPVKVRVSNKFLANKEGNRLQCVAGSDGEATWATILEKAFMKYHCVYQIDASMAGIGTENALPVYTGEGYSYGIGRNVVPEPRQVARMVRHFLREGWIVCGGFGTTGVQLEGGSTQKGHAYTAMFPYEGCFLFVMRNPHGGNGMSVPNEKKITDEIDLRFVMPGAAAPYSGIDRPYVPVI